IPYFVLVFLVPRSYPLCPYTTLFRSDLDIGTKQYATGRVIRGVVAGSCYLHDESYKGNANSHWRGIVVLNAVYPDGRFSVMDVRSEEHTSELQSRENLVCRLRRVKTE